MNNINLSKGVEIDNNKLMEIFKCANQGGMRKSNTTNTLVLISNKDKSIYIDNYENGIILYTGMGTNGDQSLSFRQNRTLAESNSNGVELHYFEKVNSIYKYYGQVKLIKEPYLSIQKDAKGIDAVVSSLFKIFL